MKNNENGDLTRMTEENKIKKHLANLFIDALLAKESSDARAKLAMSLGSDIKAHIASIVVSSQEAFAKSAAAEREALQNERERFLSHLGTDAARVIDSSPKPNERGAFNQVVATKEIEVRGLSTRVPIWSALLGSFLVISLTLGAMWLILGSPLQSNVKLTSLCEEFGKANLPKFVEPSPIDPAPLASNPNPNEEKVKTAVSEEAHLIQIQGLIKAACSTGEQESESNP